MKPQIQETHKKVMVTKSPPVEPVFKMLPITRGQRKSNEAKRSLYIVDRVYFYEFFFVTSRGYSARMHNLYHTDLIYFDDKKKSQRRWDMVM